MHEAQWRGQQQSSTQNTTAPSATQQRPPSRASSHANLDMGRRSSLGPLASNGSTTSEAGAARPPTREGTRLRDEGREKAENGMGQRAEGSGASAASGEGGRGGDGGGETGQLPLPPNPYGIFDKAKRLLGRSGGGGGSRDGSRSRDGGGEGSERSASR
ncbi:hypothetical protein LTS18_014248 [Coniosporium uncinatum]|uniref:Uncharacterized protein n=1 Tax=Coniosporium uncinatum TaxID=93489 RepID=A0ACC3CVA7_9PEZI|nr:hypothetical protein LTS18_014248 [Coniosporium uncinatum]